VDREGLLWALGIDPRGALRDGVVLLEDGPTESLLRLPTGDWILLRSVSEGDPGEGARLSERIASLARTLRASMSLLAVGVPRAPRAPLFSRLRVYAVSRAGAVRGPSFVGRASAIRAILGSAVRRLRAPDAREIRPEERAALLERGAALRSSGGDEARFWSRLEGQTPWALYSLGGAIVLVFLLESFWGGSEFSPTLYRMGADVPGTLLREPERLFAAAFLHIGIVHLLANLWALQVFGDFLERVLGTAAFLVLYAFSAVVGSLVSVAFGTAGLSAGASGALWGLMVGGFVLSYSKDLPPALRARIRARGWQPILLNLAISFAPGIALSAHMGGGLAGGVLVLLWNSLPEGALPGVRRALAPVALLLSLLMAASVGAAILRGRPWELRGPSSFVETRLPRTGRTVELPSALGPLRGAPDGEWIQGAFPHDPVVVVIRALPSAPTEPADSAPSPPQARNTSPAQELSVGGRTVTVRRYDLSRGARGAVTVGGDGSARIRVEVIAAPGAAEAWLRVGEGIAASLRAASP
jgi:rhomboid protease GluP